MDKLVLANGNEFDLVVGGVSERSNYMELTFFLGEHTAEEILNIFNGNETMTVKSGDTLIKVYTGYSVCKEVTIKPDYFYDTEYHCPECDATVPFDTTVCPECQAEFESPTPVELRTTACTVKCYVPDINSRVTDVENALDSIIFTMLG